MGQPAAMQPDQWRATGDARQMNSYNPAVQGKGGPGPGSAGGVSAPWGQQVSQQFMQPQPTRQYGGFGPQTSFGPQQTSFGPQTSTIGYGGQSAFAPQIAWNPNRQGSK